MISEAGRKMKQPGAETNSPWILKAHKCKGDGSSVVLQLNIPNFSIFVEEIFNVPLLHIHGKVPHINPSVRHRLVWPNPAIVERWRFPCTGAKKILIRFHTIPYLQIYKTMGSEVVVLLGSRNTPTDLSSARVCKLQNTSMLPQPSTRQFWHTTLSPCEVYNMM